MPDTADSVIAESRRVRAAARRVCDAAHEIVASSRAISAREPVRTPESHLRGTRETTTTEATHVSSEQFDLAVQRAGARVLVSVFGEIDVLTAPRLDDCLARLAGGPIIVDFWASTFMGSEGIALLDRAMRRAAEHDTTLQVRGLSPIQRQVLESTGFGEQLNIRDD